jgi:predicted Zn-dependent protease
MVSATIPAPALALPTSSEIQIGKEYDKQITDSNVIVTDPLLNQWVGDISNKLWSQTARKDVPYSLKIIDDSEINAFSTLGGYIYINEGTIDFVQSDDELAHVIGHETGHIERRHAVTAQNKASILNVLFSIGSLFSPILYRFGQLIQAGALARIARDDENEADKYGLMLMTRAGYDPDAALSFMSHLWRIIRAPTSGWRTCAAIRSSTRRCEPTTSGSRRAFTTSTRRATRSHRASSPTC